MKAVTRIMLGMTMLMIAGQSIAQSKEDIQGFINNARTVFNSMTPIRYDIVKGTNGLYWRAGQRLDPKTQMVDVIRTDSLTNPIQGVIEFESTGGSSEQVNTPEEAATLKSTKSCCFKDKYVARYIHTSAGWKLLKGSVTGSTYSEPETVVPADLVGGLGKIRSSYYILGWFETKTPA